ncbi:MAG TPA: hypothetical protein VN081_03845 [Dongiaceae bacterium]|nr:hypothetical protein [Dongiaceae bacterium]
MAKKKEELATVDTAALQVSPLLMEQLGSLQTDGFDNIGAEDLALPILSILQSISPQCDRKSKEYDPNVSEGEFYNSVTKKSTPVLDVVPVGYTKGYVEWTPRSSGGGFVARHESTSPTIRDAQQVGNKLVLPSGNELVETREHYLLVIPESGAPYVALLPLKSTQIKHSKRFNNETTTKVLGDRRAPMAAQRYTLSTEVESNSHGSWYGLCNIEFQGFLDDPAIITQAISAANAFSATAAKAAAGYANAAPGKSDADIDAVAASME